MVTRDIPRQDNGVISREIFVSPPVFVCVGARVVVVRDKGERPSRQYVFTKSKLYEPEGWEN